MSGLPMRPLLFIPLYLALAFGPVFAVTAGSGPALVVGQIATVAALMLQLSWIWRASEFAAATLPNRSGDSRSRFIPVAAGVLLVAAAICDRLGPPAESAVFFLIAATVLIALSTAWRAAQTLCYAEALRSAHAPAVLATFFLLVYLVVGAPFIYSRLKALAPAAQAA